MVNYQALYHVYILLACGICQAAFVSNTRNQNVGKQFLHPTPNKLNRMTTTCNAMNGSGDDDIIKGGPFNETAYNDQALKKNDFLHDVLNDGSEDDIDGDGHGHDLVGDAVVKRKKKGRGNKKYSGYKTVDNRDALPFEVRMTSPDP